ncbi:putative spermidine/putrescine transport system permease protein [Alkalithermobacter thermoalcaliphilus JW-YL-7 = DSM 7308]|uniref:ABC-type transporter, integral membrane subunit n=1 Tax=Alkalithermobacter thermoalcaliphilus JW-YL-7 = DSM 7308 TaxID=1121328 RepID=A0A150FSC2_CLOPD|nr:ABC-type transporter, integral membrane subunit [[Clostridium] paradoxum JW-YL-7 = DSM 7308]SHK76867.1 putative spermidine/putrescine transport system permease protein [[Clostridium] paradoxum JW-YL-7 = DSM 7308]
MKVTRSIIINFSMYLIISLLIVPLLILFVWSFASNWPWPYIFPRNFSLRGVEYFLSPTSNSIKILGFSVWISLIVTIITLLISIPAAKALALYDFKGKRFLNLMVLFPFIVPQISVAMGIHLVFIRLGIANTCLGVILVHLVPCIPYAIRILTGIFEIIGENMEIQAKVLGASSVQVFLNITLPLIAPGIISAGSLVFIVSFSQYFITFLIGGGRIITFPMVMFPFIQSGDRMMASVYSLVFILTTLFVLFVVEKMIKNYYKEGNNFYI